MLTESAGLLKKRPASDRKRAFLLSMYVSLRTHVRVWLGLRVDATPVSSIKPANNQAGQLPVRVNGVRPCMAKNSPMSAVV